MTDEQRFAAQFEQHRNMLRLIADLAVPPNLQAKVDPSGIVQQTFLEAFQARGQAPSEPELSRWLRTILRHNVCDAVRKVRGSPPRLAVSIEAAVDESLSRAENYLAAQDTSPSQRASREEQLTTLAHALATLPEDQRKAVVYVHLQGMSRAEAANTMERSPAAVNGLLIRGMRVLRQRLLELQETDR